MAKTRQYEFSVMGSLAPRHSYLVPGSTEELATILHDTHSVKLITKQDLSLETLMLSQKKKQN